MFSLGLFMIKALRIYDKKIKIVIHLPRWFRGYFSLCIVSLLSKGLKVFSSKIF